MFFKLKRELQFICLQNIMDNNNNNKECIVTARQNKFQFHKRMKHATVSPLIRKRSRQTVDLCPILCFMSEILQHVVYNWMTGRLQQNSLLPKFQSSCSRQHLVESVVYMLFTDGVDRGNLALLFHLNLPAAFDNVDLDILRQTGSFAISAKSLQWMD